MIRTQVQLTENEVSQLKAAAQQQRVSLAEMVRRAVDVMLAKELTVPRETLRRRARAACGRFGSGRADGSASHDEHLDEAFGS